MLVKEATGDITSPSFTDVLFAATINWANLDSRDACFQIFIPSAPVHKIGNINPSRADFIFHKTQDRITTIYYDNVISHQCIILQNRG